MSLQILMLVFVSAVASPIYQNNPAQFRGLEHEFRRALRTRDFLRAFHVETQLESQVLNSALNAVSQDKDPARRELQQLARIVARDRRMVDTLTSMIPPDEDPSINTILENSTIIDMDMTTEDVPAVIETTPMSFNTSGPIIVEEKPDEEPDSTETFTLRDEIFPKEHSQKQVEENPDEGSGESGGIIGLLTGFLGSILNAQGGIDLDALSGLLGSLSEQKPDGTYDFTGLQDTVGGVLGGGNGGGGSDVGLFFGGLASAFLKGIAGNQGAKGVGKFSGNLLLSIIPGLSGNPPPQEGQAPPAVHGQQKAIDPFGFLGGFLKTFLSGSKGVSVGPQHNGNARYSQERQRKPQKIRH